MKKKIILLVVSVFLVAGFAVKAEAKKLKECNDLQVTQCKERSDCKWVKKHMKGDKEVKAHCRKCLKKTGCKGN